MISRTPRFILILLTLVALPFLGAGCANIQTPQDLQVAVYNGSYMSAWAATKVTIKNKIVTPEQATKVQETLASLTPVVTDVANTDNLLVTVYPLCERVIATRIADPVAQSLAMAAAAAALQTAQQAIDKNPDIRNDKQQLGNLLANVMRGASDGIKGGLASPATTQPLPPPVIH